MRKVLLILLVSVTTLFFSGCFGSKKDVSKEFSKQVEKSKAYYLEGNLEIANNEEIYTYDVTVAYKDKDYFRVSLKNKTNDHEQIILKNDTGVYVLTPALNKSFKFQSEWPYNNSQSYLLQAIVKDMENDKNKKIEGDKEETIITTDVNYSNNKELVNQKIYFDNGTLKKVEVLNDKGLARIKMNFSKIDYKASYDKDYFNLDSNLDVTNSTGKTMSEIEDIIYPMYIPTNTYLDSEDLVSLDEGERVILTFSGDKPFMLIEETVSPTSENQILSVDGELEWTGDTIGVMSDGSVNWISNGIEYYAVSDILTEEELLKVANSVNTLPVGK